MLKLNSVKLGHNLGQWVQSNQGRYEIFDFLPQLIFFFLDFFKVSTAANALFSKNSMFEVFLHHSNTMIGIPL